MFRCPTPPVTSTNSQTKCPRQSAIRFETFEESTCDVLTMDVMIVGVGGSPLSPVNAGGVISMRSRSLP